MCQTPFNGQQEQMEAGVQKRTVEQNVVIDISCKKMHPKGVPTLKQKLYCSKVKKVKQKPSKT